MKTNPQPTRSLIESSAAYNVFIDRFGNYTIERAGLGRDVYLQAEDATMFRRLLEVVETLTGGDARSGMLDQICSEYF